MTGAGKGPDPEKICTLFGGIARRYDRANTILSAGIHHFWRTALVRWSGAGIGDQVLDCATGTGDLACAFKKAVGEEGDVVGTDFCEAMLEIAPEKARQRGLEIRFEPADVMNLPYDRDTFDHSAIAFGIRNVSNPVQGLREMSRVTRPGGRVMVLEFGQVEMPVFKQIYRAYSRWILPRVGGWVTGDRKAYEYLEKSSARMDCGKDFLGLLQETGTLVNAEYRGLMGGIAFMYRARCV